MTTKAEFDAYAAGAIAAVRGSDHGVHPQAFNIVVKTLQAMGDEAFDAHVEADPVEKTGADKSVSTDADAITISGAELTAEQSAALDAAVTSASTSEPAVVDAPVLVAQPVEVETADTDAPVSVGPLEPAVPVADPTDATAI